MKKRDIWLLFLGVICLAMMAACNQGEVGSSKGEDGKIQVVTTIAQIAEPLSIIGGEHIEVKSLMGPSVDPHLYNASQSDISTLDGADLIFYNGLDLEINMVKIFDQIGQSKPVLAVGDAIAESDLLEEETGVVDPHIWFDIDLWKQALEAAVEELKEYAPEIADELEGNKEAYFEELDTLQEDAERMLSEIPENQRYLVTAHDAFGYFGAKFNLEVIGLQGLSTDGEVGMSDIRDTINLITEYEVPAIFVESSVSPDAINSVIEGAASDGVEVEIGGELFSDAMGEANSEEGTYLGMYRHNVTTIYEALVEGAE
ncbi:metal ABC transporter solute-binding protein, Zn/Mn family [Alkalihalobacillus pseudalcaliphilus]|uniref:metal ABC transporter solute-binding protein, Zn/Mn family n=1 Tax=Alkalihalobacillus pseudalcaliphilus TaxID=79884 RepID=UPI00064DF3FA|nr:zinc ABC transporter substrate-binding protein [Alkalihalobacillus pseudalcaliphilus]KMK78133.1 manganese transporter [Alkalihalobacillus pseudalcaliphilus]